MGVGRIGKTRARPGSLKKNADADRRLAILEQASSRRAAMGHKALGLIVAIIAVGYVIGWMRTSLFGPSGP
jgi:hypothetical protein